MTQFQVRIGGGGIRPMLSAASARIVALSWLGPLSGEGRFSGVYVRLVISDIMCPIKSDVGV